MRSSFFACWSTAILLVPGSCLWAQASEAWTLAGIVATGILLDRPVRDLAERNRTPSVIIYRMSWVQQPGSVASGVLRRHR